MMDVRSSRGTSAPQRTAVICSCHFNAVGIAISLREAGWTERIVCLKINEDGACAAERWPRLCECWSLRMQNPEDLIEQLAQRLHDSCDSLFFCDERFMPLAASPSARSRLAFAHCFLGSDKHLETILDRRRFYDFLETNHLAPVPRTIPSTENPWQAFGGAFRTRVWCSWRGMEKLPRGRTIRTAADLAAWNTDCQRQAIQPDQWGYQELLSTRPDDVVSFCGWHGPNRRVYVATRWIYQQGENGWLIESIPEPSGLRETTCNVLEALEYHGPFELEFLFDPRAKLFKVIELNPRFWMQHRIVGKILVEEYLGVPVSPKPLPRGRYWLNTDVAIWQMLTLRGFKLFPYLPSALWAVPVSRSLLPVLRNARAGLHRRIRGG